MSEKVSIEDMVAFFALMNMTPSDLLAWEKIRKERSAEELKSEAWKSAEKAYYKHLSWRFDYPRKIFSRQKIAYWLIMIIVFVIVGAGVWFSYIQLSWSIKIGNLSGLQTELAATAKSLSISSSIIGLFVLIVSLAFFYLFLKHVFEIKYPLPPLVQMEKELLEKTKKAEGIVQKDKDHISNEEFEELKKNLNSLKCDIELMMHNNQMRSGSLYYPFLSGLSGSSGYGTSGGWPIR